MNKFIAIGRLTRDVEVSYSGEQTAIARFGIAINRSIGEGTDFINCVAFGKNAEFCEKYLHKGMKVAFEGRIQTGSYTNRDGQKVNTTDFVIERSEFVEKREEAPSPSTGFVSVPDGIDEMLPFAQPTR